MLIASLIGIGLGHIAISMLVYSTIALMVFVALSLHLPHTSFGPANRFSLARGVIVAILAGFAWSVPSSMAAAWIICVLAMTALVLDGVDGAVARRSGITSELGARFDGELDGLLTLILSVIVFLSGRVEAFVLLAGLLHYVFLLARAWRIVPRVDLPASFRRQTAGVTASILLVAACAPSFGTNVDTALALAAVFLLLTSFAIDLITMFKTTRSDDMLTSDEPAALHSKGTT